MRTVIVVISVIAVGILLSGTATAQTFRATINAAQQVPPNASPGTGQGCMTYDPATMMLSFEINYAGLLTPEIAAHFHGPAPAGSNAGVQFALPLGAVKAGSVGPLSSAQEADLFAGLWYINIHTTPFPGGEIRGQVTSHPTPCTIAVNDGTWGSVKALFDVRY